jgi:hypothetical protein
VSPFSLSTDNHIVVFLISKLRRCYWRCWAMIGLRPTWGSLGVDSLTFIITKVSTHSQDPDGCTIITEDAQGTNKWILSEWRDLPGMKKLFFSFSRSLPDGGRSRTLTWRQRSSTLCCCEVWRTEVDVLDPGSRATTLSGVPKEWFPNVKAGIIIFI